jgi:hypothetical protein
LHVFSFNLNRRQREARYLCLEDWFT